jgi:hypothetical protein
MVPIGRTDLMGIGWLVRLRGHSELMGSTREGQSGRKVSTSEGSWGEIYGKENQEKWARSTAHYIIISWVLPADQNKPVGATGRRHLTSQQQKTAKWIPALFLFSLLFNNLIRGAHWRNLKAYFVWEFVQSNKHKNLQTTTARNHDINTLHIGVSC